MLKSTYNMFPIVRTIIINHEPIFQMTDIMESLVIPQKLSTKSLEDTTNFFTNRKI